MDSILDAAQTDFRDDVRAFLRERLPAGLREGLRLMRQQVTDWQRALFERGWGAPHWPREFGGADLGQTERLILVDELKRASAPMHFNLTMLGPVLMRYGTEAQKRDWLPKLTNLDVWASHLTLEPCRSSRFVASDGSRRAP